MTGLLEYVRIYESGHERGDIVLQYGACHNISGRLEQGEKLIYFLWKIFVDTFLGPFWWTCLWFLSNYYSSEGYEDPQNQCIKKEIDKDSFGITFIAVLLIQAK